MYRFFVSMLYVLSLSPMIKSIEKCVITFLMSNRYHCLAPSCPNPLYVPIANVINTFYLRGIIQKFYYNEDDQDNDNLIRSRRRSNTS